MDKRQFLSLSLGASLSSLQSGCNERPKPSPTATLLNNDDIADAVDELAGSLQELEITVEDFSSEDWREVVPRVRDAVHNVRSNLGRLQHELGYF